MSGHRLVFEETATTFTVERLRRDRNELVGELTVRCKMPGAKVTNGDVLSTGDFNFSSVSSRQTRAKLLAERARSNGKVDWFAYLEEFCQGVFDREREGDPCVDLRSLPRPDRDELRLDGIVVPRRHPTIVFGDGGGGKSYLALWWAANLVRQHGMSIGLFDWELSGEDHRDRLELLYGDEMPLIHYLRCETTISHEIDRIARVIREKKIDYAIFDSIAFACDGPPESAEIAGKYFRALRQLNIGTLHIAHVNKSETSDRKPFGSSFWHNGARSTWFIEAEQRDGDETTLQVGLFNRKSNLGKLGAPISYKIHFEPEFTSIARADLADSEQLSERLSIKQRMWTLLSRSGSLTAEAIAEEIGEETESVKRAYRRSRKNFVLLSGGRIGILGHG